MRGGSFRAPNETNNCSAATRASAEGGVGKGKFTTCTNRKYEAVLCLLFHPETRLDKFKFHWPYLCWDLSSVRPDLPQACEWFRLLRTSWSLQTPQTSTTCRNITDPVRHTWITSSSKLHCYTVSQSWPVAVSRLCSSRSTCPLIGWGLWRPCDFKGWHSSHSVVETLLNSTAVDHVLNTRDGQRRLSHVGGYNTETSTRWRRPEHLHSKHT